MQKPTLEKRYGKTSQSQRKEMGELTILVPEKNEFLMKLEKYKDDSYEFSKLASDLVRQFAFAGIAIIWIFKYDKPEQHLIPLVATLAFDFLQYLIPTIAFTVFFRYHEHQNQGNTNVDVKASGWLSAPGWVCFICKVISLGTAYYYISTFLFEKF